jgi:hypothetical protein
MITTRVTSPFGFESTAAEVIAARDLATAERTAAGIRAATGNPAVWVARLDLLDRGSVVSAGNMPGPVGQAGAAASFRLRNAGPAGPCRVSLEW